MKIGSGLGGLRVLFQTALLLLFGVAGVWPQDLEVRFLDVGQGDAVLVRNGEKTALIDAGPSDRITERLRALRVHSLDLLIASHNHADHIGGADAVLETIPTRYYLDNGYPASTLIQRKILTLLERPGTQYLAAGSRTISLGDATLRIIPPPLGPEGREQNNRSVAVVIERAGFRALLTGDSEIGELNAWLRTNDIPDVDVLKAAHHGSRNGLTPAWLARTQPEIVVISVGANNSYGHPHAAALRYYEAGNRRVLRTDKAGDVIILVDPHGCYEVRTTRDAVRSAPRFAPDAPTQRPPTVPPARTPRASSCCRVCRSGKPCGDSCISRNHVCRKQGGCACGG